MIAPAVLPPEYAKWNRRWHAPFGRSVPFNGSGALARSRPVLLYRGPFVFQPNSATREFEYPWAHAQVQSRLASGSIVEIGGGLAGLQFVLAREGYDVINVDPGLAAEGRGWDVPLAAHQYIAKIFRAPARLIPTTLDRTGLPAHSVDLVLTISTLEHLTAGELDAVADSIRQLLKSGGLIVMTVDLFLDLAPFTTAQRNKWGTNVDIRAFLSRAGVELIAGDPREIFGFPEFDGEAIARKRESFLIGDASLAQCLVARAASSQESMKEPV